MEVKINREIRNYTEAIFFGLSLRQFIFSALAVLAAGVSFFFLNNTLGVETASWVSILICAPFAALGFISYNGMPAEKFLLTWIKSEFILPRRLRFHEINLYYTAVKGGKSA